MNRESEGHIFKLQQYLILMYYGGSYISILGIFVNTGRRKSV